MFLSELEKAIGTECKTLLDVGCGSASPIRFFAKRFYSVGVDDVDGDGDRGECLMPLCR
jgi:cyclopropane fatty-acyl-phospholipid synthase-like methyltransferase